MIGPVKQKPEWICFNYDNITRLMKFQPGPGLVAPAYYDWNMGLLKGTIRFVYSHSTQTERFIRHVYKILKNQ